MQWHNMSSTLPVACTFATVAVNELRRDQGTTREVRVNTGRAGSPVACVRIRGAEMGGRQGSTSRSIPQGAQLVSEEEEIDGAELNLAHAYRRWLFGQMGEGALRSRRPTERS